MHGARGHQQHRCHRFAGRHDESAEQHGAATSKSIRIVTQAIKTGADSIQLPSGVNRRPGITHLVAPPLRPGNAENLLPE
jgi:hypothetical protein